MGNWDLPSIWVYLFICHKEKSPSQEVRTPEFSTCLHSKKFCNLSKSSCNFAFSSDLREPETLWFFCTSHTTWHAGSYLYNHHTLRVCKLTCQMRLVISGLFPSQGYYEDGMRLHLWECSAFQKDLVSLSFHESKGNSGFLPLTATTGWAVSSDIGNLRSAEFHKYPNPHCPPNSC